MSGANRPFAACGPARAREWRFSSEFEAQYGTPIYYHERGYGHLAGFVKFHAPGVSTTSFLLFDADREGFEVVYASKRAYKAVYDPERDRLLAAELETIPLYRGDRAGAANAAPGRILAVDAASGRTAELWAPDAPFAPTAIKADASGGFVCADACAGNILAFGPGGGAPLRTEMARGLVQELALGPDGDVYMLVRADKGFFGWPGDLPVEMAYRLSGDGRIEAVYRSWAPRGQGGFPISIEWWDGLVVSSFDYFGGVLEGLDASGRPLWLSQTRSLAGEPDAYAWSLGISRGRSGRSPWMSVYCRTGWRFLFPEPQDGTVAEEIDA